MCVYQWKEKNNNLKSQKQQVYQAKVRVNSIKVKEERARQQLGHWKCILESFCYLLLCRHVESHTQTPRLVISEKGEAVGKGHQVPNIKLLLSNLPWGGFTSEMGPVGAGGACSHSALMGGEVTARGIQGATQDWGNRISEGGTSPLRRGTPHQHCIS